MINLIKSPFYKKDIVKKKLSDFINNSDYFSMGQNVYNFQDKFAEFQGCKYAVMFNSGSSANLALMQSLKNLNLIADSALVGFSALTWATNVMPIIQMDALAVPFDIEIDTLNTSLQQIKTRKIDALFITNALGLSGDLTEIAQYCQENDIILLEDNCESLGSIRDGVKLGNFGLASTFSFFVGHHLSTIEGGMVCTDNYDIYKSLLMVREHGWARRIHQDTRNRLKELHNINDYDEPYTFYQPGYNLRPTEISAVIGLAQMEYLTEIIAQREFNFYAFMTAATVNEKIIPIDVMEMDIVSNFAFPMVFKSHKDKLEAIEKFEKNDIETRPIIGGNICNQPFYKKSGQIVEEMPNADFVARNGFYIPNNPELTVDELNLMIGLISE